MSTTCVIFLHGWMNVDLTIGTKSVNLAIRYGDIHLFIAAS